MNELMGWIAPAATMIAAMVTAANLGARVTGWGFVLFVVGSIAWAAVAAASGQGNLLLTNGVLTIVNIFGVWRWLGRQARYADGGRVAAEDSRRRHGAPTLFPLGSIEGRCVEASDGVVIGHVVDAMARAGRGSICYLVLRAGGVGGVGETLRAIGWEEVAAVEEDRLVATVPSASFARRPVLDAACWPATAREAGIGG